MILNDADYQQNLALVAQLRSNILQQEQNFLAAGMTPEQTSKALGPTCQWFHKVNDDMALYAGIQRGEYTEELLKYLGYVLTMLRIAHNISQEQLARMLNRPVSEIDFNERNEYPRITLEQASEVLVALGIYVT